MNYIVLFVFSNEVKNFDSHLVWQVANDSIYILRMSTFAFQSTECNLLQYFHDLNLWQLFVYQIRPSKLLESFASWKQELAKWNALYFLGRKNSLAWVVLKTKDKENGNWNSSSDINEILCKTHVPMCIITTYYL